MPRPPLVINDTGEGNDWVPEAHGATRSGSWGAAMAQALLDAGMERARIGVSGLKAGKASHIRAADGVVSHGAYVEVQRRLPNATFVDGTDAVGFARYVKSEEEIALLRRAVAIALEGIGRMVEVARPGVECAVLYARVMRRILELGSEYHPLAVDIGPLGPSLPRYENPPIGRRLEPMTLITNEVDAILDGLCAQEVQPILLGPIPEQYKPVIEFQRELYEAGLEFFRPIPEDWKPVIELQGEVFTAGLERMRPGTRLVDVVDFVDGYGAGRGVRTVAVLEGRGLGDDGPVVPAGAKGADLGDLRIEPGTVWSWRPYAASADSRIRFSWGGDVAVTDRDAEPLFRRPHCLICIA